MLIKVYSSAVFGIEAISIGDPRVSQQNLQDLIALHIQGPSLLFEKLSKGRKGESRADIRKRVTTVREKQTERLFFLGIYLITLRSIPSKYGNSSNWMTNQTPC